MIPVLGFATLKRFDLADRLLASIDYPVEHLVIVNNSGSVRPTQPKKPDLGCENLWHIRSSVRSWAGRCVESGCEGQHHMRRIGCW
jgi:hypothetical protein